MSDVLPLVIVVVLIGALIVAAGIGLTARDRTGRRDDASDLEARADEPRDHSGDDPGTDGRGSR